jgi:hypothetical protein
MPSACDYSSALYLMTTTLCVPAALITLPFLPDGNSHEPLPVVLVKGGLPDSDVVVVPGVAPDPVEGGTRGAEEGRAEATGQHHPGRLPHVNLLQLGSSSSSSVS